MITLTGAHLVTSGELVDIVMNDGIITAVRPTVVEEEIADDAAESNEDDASGGDTTIDAGGGFVLPGLIDAHVHLLDADELTTLTDFGVTTAVELGTTPDSLIDELRAAEGVTSIVSAGAAASAPGATQTTTLGFPEESTVTGPDDASRFVTWRAQAGADVIKIIIEDPHGPSPALEPETLKAIVEAAHGRDLLTVAHAVTAYSYTMALDAGVDVITHAPLDAPLDDETIERMVKAKTRCVPTLTMLAAAVEAFAGRPGPELSYDHAAESVRRMHEAGVPIAAGTDANMHPKTPAQIPHGTSLHEELERLVEAGLSPVEAIAAATSEAATMFGLEKLGVIEPGARADLVVLTSDPRENIGISRSISQVWIAGEQVR